MATSLTISVLADVSKAVAGIDSITKRTSSWGSNLKSAGLAIAGAFSISKIEGWAKEWIAAGLEARGAAKNVGLVFGAAAEEVNKWADTTSTHFGMTASAAEQAAAKVGVALKGFGMSQADAAKTSELLVQRSADMAKVMGVDQAEVLAKLETAMRGRTAGLKDYGVEVAKGADATSVLNAFLTQTSEYSGRADTPLGNLHATMGDLKETIGQALVPALMAVIPLFQAVGDWAKNHHAAFVAIVLVLVGVAGAFSVAATAASIFAIASLGALWPILAVVAGLAAIVAIVVVVIKYWGDLVGWFHTATSAIGGVIEKLGPLVALFGPLGAAILVVEHLAAAWGAVERAIHGVESAIHAVSSAASAIGGLLSKIPGIGGHAAGVPAAGGPTPYGTAPTAAPVVFAPSITFTGDVGDPTLAGRRIVAALEAWTAANGRRRIAALVSP